MTSHSHDIARLAFVGLLATSMLACRDAERFTTTGDHYEGVVVQGTFTRAGVPSGLRACVEIDGAALQTNPGSVRTSDHRFDGPLRPIPELFHDPLSTLSFGEGRERNYLFGLTPHTDGGAETSATAVVSLMAGGSIELRLLRGAAASADGTTAEDPERIFAVFPLERRDGPCPF